MAEMLNDEEIQALGSRIGGLVLTRDNCTGTAEERSAWLAAIGECEVACKSIPEHRKSQSIEFLGELKGLRAGLDEKLRKQAADKADREAAEAKANAAAGATVTPQPATPIEEASATS